jgi:peptidoglycan/xylan/chitin deacetylase (PgdA/CDA1 family)
MLAVIAPCLAAFILAGTHIGHHYGLLRGNLLGWAAARGANHGAAARPDGGILHESGWLHTNSGAALLLPRSPSIMSRPPLRAGSWVPILMYHYVRYSPDRAGVPLSVLPPDFQAQMQYLKDHGYTTISMRDLDLVLMGRTSAPPKPVALTFDDGYEDFYSTAVPVMQRLGLTATNYIPTMLIGRPNYMTWSEVQRLDEQGFEMAAHSQFHVDVARVPVGRAQVEIFGAKSDLERQLGHAVVDWAYPYGGFSYATVQLVHQAGYVSGATTQPGGWHDATHMPLLTRVRVNGGESLWQFARSLLGY